MKRQAKHERRVEFLDTLAVLLGCEGTLGGTLPDGRRPDVLRIDPRRRVLFIGDAKHSETPGNRETQARLLRYLRWLLSHVENGGLGVFAVCFGKDPDIGRWTDTLTVLSSEVGLEQTRRGTEWFEPGLTVVWAEFGSRRTVTE